MSQYDFRYLYEKYPDMIRKMPSTFTAHEFIVRLAWDNQVLFIDALQAYRDVLRDGRPAAFQVVHGILAKALYSCTNLITYVGEDKYGRDLYNEKESYSRWLKTY